MKKTLFSICLWGILIVSIQAQSRFKTVNFLNSIKGKQILSGQHNDQKNLDCGSSGATGARYWTDQVYSITGKYPALYGGDMLFHGSNQLRWDMTYEAERQWNSGAMVNIMWHACPPTQGASCGWDGGLLSSISAQQFAELLTNGSALNNTWKSRVNEIAVYLQYLEDKGVEVLWRPYHEQNQTAFWWNSQGVDNTKALWRMMHNYMTNDLGLTNLVWVLDVQDIGGRTNFWDYNPGNQYWDIMALDIYADGLTNPEYYNNMITASSGKLVALGECFNLPNAQAIDRFPQYGFFMNWAYGLKKWYAPDCRPTNTDAFIREVYNNPKVITRDEMPGWNNVNAPVNLATARPITVSSTEAGANVASNAVDGSYSTRWSSLYTDAQWLSLDLGANYNVNRVKISWEAAYGRDYTIQYSDNGNVWTIAKTITNNAALTNDHIGLSGAARYVRINGTARATAFGYSIFELEVYGTAVPINQSPILSLTLPSPNATFIAPASVTINANATDADGSISKVDFYNGTTLLNSDNTAPYSYVWTNVVAGNYSITARATDNNGAITISSTAGIVVNNPVVPPATSATKVVAYVANWNDLNTYSTTIDYSKLTHINIAFENPNSNGDLSFNSGDAALIQRAHANNVKVYVSIGGGAASTDQTIQNNYFSLISDSRRAGFVAKIASYLQARNFDGLDVDLEGPAINGDYSKFIADLSAALRPAGKGLTAALSQGYGGGNVPSSTFANFDFINIMAYDATGSWAPNSPGQHSSYSFAQSNLQYWLGRGLPKNKAVLGVPFYGWGFGTDAGEWSYNRVVSTYAGAENVDQAGNTIWYNGIPTMKAKVNYAFDQGIAGVMIWELSQDAAGSKSLLLAIDQVVKSRGTVVPVPDNLAKGKLVTVSSTEVGANIASNAVDGSYGSRWSSLYTDAQWLTVDLGANYNISRVKISWEAAFGKDYTINVSSNGTTWTTMRSVVGNTSLTNDLTGLTGSCRYLSVNATARGTVYGYSIFELEVYGTPVTTINQGPVVSITAPSNNASFTAPANVAITANATDNDGSISKVDFYNGATLLATDNTAPYTYTATGFGVGSYSITARATDNVGAVTTSSAVTVSVTSVVVANNPPIVSITEPANNGNFTAPATVVITANATDSDGSITKVDFYNGTTLLTNDFTAPYTYTITNLTAGTYTITARATDNSGTGTTSSAVAINVIASANACSSIAQYVENGGYVVGSKVKNAGRQFTCKPYPYSGWCNGASWAYGPGVGSYWQDAWVDNGSCTARLGAVEETASYSSTEITLVPNPVLDVLTFNLMQTSTVRIFNAQGVEVVSETVVEPNETIQLSKLPAGIYQVRIDSGDVIFMKKIVKN